MNDHITVYNSIAEAPAQIRRIVEQSRQQLAQLANTELLHAYWEIGQVIVEQEQHGNTQAGYGKSLIKSLSKELSRELGKGFSVSNVFNMRNFYLTYQKFQTVSGKLRSFFNRRCKHEIFQTKSRSGRTLGAGTVAGKTAL